MFKELGVILILVLSTLLGLIAGIVDIRSNKSSKSLDRNLIIVSILILFTSGLILSFKFDIVIVVIVAVISMALFIFAHGIIFVFGLLWMFFIPTIKDFLKKFHCHIFRLV